MNGLNSRMLKVHGNKLVEVVEAGLLNDQGLRLQWRTCLTVLISW